MTLESAMMKHAVVTNSCRAGLAFEVQQQAATSSAGVSGSHCHLPTILTLPCFCSPPLQTAYMYAQG